MENKHSVGERIGGAVLLVGIILFIAWIFSVLFAGIGATIIVLVILAIAILAAIYSTKQICIQISEEKKMTTEQKEQLRLERIAFKERESQKDQTKEQREKELIERAKSLSTTNSNQILCPNCKGKNIEFMGNDRKSFSVGKAAAGAALTGGIGTLAGFAGKKGNNQWFCKDCNQVFETKK